MTNVLKIKKYIDESDAIVIGAGAGLSDAAGIHYSGDEFNHDFIDYIRKYGITDLYSASFYPFKTEEEKWAFWAKHIYYAYYERKQLELYKDILELIKDKDYFVITTNVDGKFLQNGFDNKKIFEVQGSYSKLQCANACHNKVYDNEEMVKNWLSNTSEDLKIPTYLVPKCPVCSGRMEPNLRCDDKFIQDDDWYAKERSYDNFLKKYNGKKILFLEFGVGFNTPGIIRFPFEQMTFLNHNAKLIRFNKNYSEVSKEIEDRSISVDDDIREIVDLVKKLLLNKK